MWVESASVCPTLLAFSKLVISGLAYVAPVSTLLKWFPDRPGLAAGVAVCGFGGGAIIGSPLATALFNSVGVGACLLILAAIYFVMMASASRVLRFPPAQEQTSAHADSDATDAHDQTAISVADSSADAHELGLDSGHSSAPAHSSAAAKSSKPDTIDAHASGGGLTLRMALRTRQFYLLWLMLFINISAGISLISQLALMLQVHSFALLQV